jgi:trypsin
MTRLLTCLLAALAAVCALTSPGVARALPAPVAHADAAAERTAIVGGSTAGTGSFPWMAFITMDDGAHECSGTVISPDLVLTAGHCDYDTETGRMFAPGRMRVTTGSLDWTAGAARQVTGVRRTWPAPGYDPATGDHDAAILQLDRPTSAPAVALASPSQDALPAAGSAVVVAGWGLTDPAVADSQPAVLQWAPTVLQAASWCGARLSSFDPAGQLCTSAAPARATSVCNGDSGGPVLAGELSGQSGTPTEIAVINQSDDCSVRGPNYSTRVDALWSWAQRLIQAYPAGGATARDSARALGTLTMRAAQRDLWITLTRRFGRAFTQGRGLHGTCRRRSAGRVVCRIAWRDRSHTYRGTVTIRLGLRHGRVVWVGHYGIRAYRRR